jgi:DNA polymerase III subunit beta
MGPLAHCLVGNIAPAVAFAAAIIPDRTTIPILGNVLLTAKSGSLSIVATDLDRRTISRVNANIIKPGAVTVDAAKLAAWLRRHDDSADVELITTNNGFFVRIDQSSLYLRTLPVDDFPVPFSTDATISLRLTEAEYCQLFKQTALVIPATEVRPALCGLYLRYADHKLIAVATEGRRIVEVSIDAPADLPEFAIIIPRDVVFAIAKMEGDIDLRIGERFVEIENGNSTLTSRLIAVVFPAYRHALPNDSGSTIEVDRAALVDALELVRAAIGRPAETGKPQPPFASLTWTDGAGEMLMTAGPPRRRRDGNSRCRKGRRVLRCPAHAVRRFAFWYRR